ncbi:MAG: hypothetical protein AAGA83_06940 [Cyanobacteria bacterium P01_F01_bin.116]
MAICHGAIVVMLCVSSGAGGTGRPWILIESGGRIFLYRLAL